MSREAWLIIGMLFAVMVAQQLRIQQLPGWAYPIQIGTRAACLYTIHDRQWWTYQTAGNWCLPLPIDAFAGRTR